MDTIFRQPGKTGTKKDLATRSVKMSRITFYLCAGICSMASLSAVNPPEKPFGEQYSRQLSMIAKKYYDNKEYDKAFTYYKTAADQGDVISQYELGEMYRLGRGTHTNADLAVKYYDIAISGGDVMSVEALGKLIKEGNIKAFESIKFHADSGNIMAYYMMQVYANNGMDKAIKWLEMTALNGNVIHQSKLGRMYFEGMGVKQDFPKAFLWSQMAAENDDTQAQNLLGVLYLKTAYPDYETSFKWLKISAKKGYLQSFYNLIMLAEKGYIGALQYLQKKSKKGDQSAKCVLGYMYMHGKCVDQDTQKAIQLFKQSYEVSDSIKHLEEMVINDDLNALYALEEIATDEKSYRLFSALDSLERLASNGNVNALISLINIMDKEDPQRIFGAAHRLKNIANSTNVLDEIKAHASIALVCKE